MSEDQMGLLLVEDDDAVGATLVRGLGLQGFRVRWVTRAADALSEVAQEPPDVLLLDLGLPDLDGLEACRQLRDVFAGPLLVVSARRDEPDRVLGLEVGADDYVVKPVGLHELAARIRAVQRRGRHQERVVRRGSLTVYVAQHRADLDGTALDFTPTEFAVLAVLAQAGGALVARADLVTRVWGRGWPGVDRTLNVHIAALRRKLGDPEWVTVTRGVGLRLVPPERSEAGEPR